MPPTAMITGITGQDGTYLAQVLLEQGYQVYGRCEGRTTRESTRSRGSVPASSSSKATSSITRRWCGFGNVPAHQVYNLGAISFVGLSFKQALLTGEVTGLGVVRVLEAIRTTVTPDGSQLIFWQGPANTLWEAWWAGGHWNGPVNWSAAAFHGTGALVSSPSVALAGTTQLLFWAGAGGHLLEAWWLSGEWNGPVDWSG